MQTHLTANRAVGAFPISIATSIALEHVFGVQSEANPEPKPKAIQNYREFWINIKTLFRNLHGSLEKQSAPQVLADEMADALWQDMETLASMVNQYSNGVTKVVFYLSNYKGIKQKFKMAIVKGDHTEKQLAYAMLMENTIKKLLKDHGRTQEQEIRLFDVYLQPTVSVSTLILTHIAYDLVSYRNFGKLSLIESHTGTIKTREMWYTKYHSGKDLPMLPFMEGLLPVFGDNEFFSPLNRKSRAEVLELATKYSWDPSTTREKILYSVDKLQNPYLKEAIHSFFH